MEIIGTATEGMEVSITTDAKVIANSDVGFSMAPSYEMVTQANRCVKIPDRRESSQSVLQNISPEQVNCLCLSLAFQNPAQTDMCIPNIRATSMNAKH
jgi:hypothetical protein